MAGEDREKGDFEKGLERLAGRRTIESLGQKGQTGPVLRKQVKEEALRLDVPRLINGLVEKQFVIDEKRAAVAADLSIELQEHFGREGIRGLAVVLLGSAVHGGVLTRRMMGTKKSGDFDYGIILDGKDIDMKKFRGIRREMRDYVTDRLTQLSEKYEIWPALERCVEMNPLNRWAWNLVSLTEVMTEFHRRDKFEYDDPMYLYFFPSFPAKNNQRNRELMLEGFSRLARLDRGKWQQLTASFIEGWQGMHKIEIKHLTDVDEESLLVEDIRRRDIELIRNVGGSSQFQMGKRMEELILATGKTEK